MQPIRMTQEMADTLMNEFYSKVLKMGNITGAKVSFDKNFVSEQKDAVEVNFTTEAFEQMKSLIQHFSSEVAWHGLVNRIDETHFQITKILVYPQKVTGATVNTDYEKYQPWLYALSDDDFNTLRFQGHSHVNMAVTPSSVDIGNWWSLINNLGDEDYYIFMIWNKSGKYTVRVVDMKKNVIYSGNDVKVTIGSFCADPFLEEAEKMVEKPVYKAVTTSVGTVYAGGAFSSNTGAAAKEPAKKTVTGAAAPKVNGEYNSNLMNYYANHRDELEENYNYSCYPYSDLLD